MDPSCSTVSITCNSVDDAATEMDDFPSTQGTDREFNAPSPPSITKCALGTAVANMR